MLLRGLWPGWCSWLELLLSTALLFLVGVLLAHLPLLLFSVEATAGQYWANAALATLLLAVAIFTVCDGVLAWRRVR